MTSKKLTKLDKNKITDDWNSLFPSLDIYEPMHLLNRIGPLLVGIKLEVKSGNDKYFPTFHVHNLASSTDFISLSLAYNPNMKFLRLGEHETEYKKVALMLKQNAPVSFEGVQDLNTILKGFEEFVGKSLGHIIPQTFEDMALISGWCGSHSEIERSLTFARSHMEPWGDVVLSRIGGLDNWLSNLEERSTNKQKLYDTFEQQINYLQVDKVPVRTFKC